tara:strand:+ start:4185 stop:4940 length:756 start_codon:yes stop_codon:yes gene_type:complete
MKTYIKRAPVMDYGDEALKREMMILVAQLNGLNFVPKVEKIACDSEGLYLELAHIEGETIKQVMKREKRFGLGTLEFWEVLAKRLGEVHDKGVVHHDVSSSNVMIRGVIYENDPVILDFGFSNVFSLMRPGYTVGNPCFISPEQAMAYPSPFDVNDSRGDIYSLGALMYFCLSGNYVFTVPEKLKLNRSQRAQFLARMHVIAKPEPLYRRRKGIPISLSEVVMECLEKDPNDRFDSAFDLAFALREVRKSL